MKNKKYLVSAGIAAAALAVGGTAAFFTSSDFITNPFATGTTNEEGSTGIDVVEDFRTLGSEETYLHAALTAATGEDFTFVNTNPSRGFEEYDNDDDDMTSLGDNYGENPGPDGTGPSEMLPGELFVKQMRVDSTVNYDQYLRIMPIVTLNGTTVDLTTLLSTLKIVDGVPWFEITIPDEPGALLVELDPTVLTEWTIGDDGYFYYDFIFEPNTTTNDIVKSVVLSADAGNAWQNVKFDITIEGQSIQATTDAWDSWATELQLEGSTPLALPVVMP